METEADQWLKENKYPPILASDISRQKEEREELDLAGNKKLKSMDHHDLKIQLAI